MALSWAALGSVGGGHWSQSYFLPSRVADAIPCTLLPFLCVKGAHHPWNAICASQETKLGFEAWGKVGQEFWGGGKNRAWGSPYQLLL